MTSIHRSEDDRAACSHRWLIVAMLMFGFALAACTGAADVETDEPGTSVSDPVDSGQSPSDDEPGDEEPPPEPGDEEPPPEPEANDPSSTTVPDPGVSVDS